MSLVAAFPLGTSYLPGEAVILRVFETRYLQLLRDVGDTSRSFVTALIEAGSEVGGGEKRFDAGVTVSIDHIAPAEFGFQLFAHAENVVDIVDWNDDLEYPRAEVTEQPLVITDSEQARGSLRSVADDIRRLVERVQGLGLATGEYTHLDAVLGLDGSIGSDSEMWATLWRLAALVPCTPLDKYEFLRPGDLVARSLRIRDAVGHINDLLTFRYG